MRFWFGSPVAGSAVAAEFLFVQNYFEGLWTHTWSLAVEEHFYLILPTLLLVLWKRDPSSKNPFNKLPTIIAVVAVLTLLARLATSYTGEYASREMSFPTHLRLDSLFFGVLLSYLTHYTKFIVSDVSSRVCVGLIFVGVACFAPAFIWEKDNTPWLSIYGYTFLYLGSGCLLVGSQIIDRRPHGPLLKAFGIMGSHSYSIYLWHGAVLFWGIRLAQTMLHTTFSYPVTVVVYIAGSIAVGMILSLLWEDPVLKLRNRLFPSESASPVGR